jgi:hypothetical protein
VLGLDDILERRREAKIQAKGIDRDPARSSHSPLVKASGLRWLSLMLLVPIPWAKRVWALPFLTILVPSERYHQERRQRHKKLTDWVRQMLLIVRRWAPELSFVPVRGWYGEPERVVEITSATAVWYQSGTPPLPIRWGPGRDSQGEVTPQALLGTDVTVDPVQLLEWFVLRWRLEGMWQEARAHVGLETQRQWKAKAIARTTPALLGLLSMVTLTAGQLAPEHVPPVRQAVWYRTPLPTFADAIAIVRQHLWPSTHLPMPPANADLVDISCGLLNRLTDTLCNAA